jgi:hypothetical protein
MSVFEIERELAAAEELARAERCLRMAGEPVPSQFVGCTELASTLRAKLAKARDEQRVADEKAQRKAEADAEREHGRLVANAVAELRGRREMLAHWEAEVDRFETERTQLQNGDAVRRFMQSDMVANRGGVGAAWGSRLKQLFVSGGPLRNDPAGWMLVAGPVPDGLPIDVREYAANWPRDLRWTPDERGEVCRWHVLADEVRNTRAQRDATARTIDALLDEFPFLRALDAKAGA